MISEELRDMRRHLEIHAGYGCLSGPLLKAAFAKLMDLADRVEALENAQVGAPARAVDVTGENVVALRPRPQSAPLRRYPGGGGDAA